MVEGGEGLGLVVVWKEGKKYKEKWFLSCILYNSRLKGYKDR